MNPIKILLVGGTWELGETSEHCGHKSSVVDKLYNSIAGLNKVNFDVDCAMFNGGNFSVLNKCLDCTKDADITSGGGHRGAAGCNTNDFLLMKIG